MRSSAHMRSMDVRGCATGAELSEAAFVPPAAAIRMRARARKPNEVKTNTYRGLPVIWTSGRSTPLGTLVYGTYKAETRAKTGSPAGGYKFALDVISSGLCTRVDLYGYTALGTGKYFARAKLMKTVHISGVEHWTYRVLQEQGAACVYD